MQAKDIREKSQTELERELAEKSESARKLRFDIALREARNHAEYRKLRKDMARIKTVLRERELGIDEA